jgi:RNase adapter protein RapZ
MTDFVVITGMSGAGRSTAAGVFEDEGWFVIDNMPVALMPKVAELATQPASAIDRVAFVAGWNTDPAELTPMLDDLRSAGSTVRTIFLDAATDVLIRRYESTRRRHPASGGRGAGRCDRTGAPAARALACCGRRGGRHHGAQRPPAARPGARAVRHESAGRGMQVTVTSFGFKHGLPSDVDMVLDCRFLPNPHWVDDLRPLTGVDAAGARLTCSTPTWPSVPGPARRAARRAGARPSRRRARPTSRWRSAAPEAGTGRWPSPRR